MLNIHGEMVEKMKKMDEVLQKNFLYLYNEPKEIRQKLQKFFVQIRQLEKKDSRILSNWLENKQAGAVDGSVNRTKGDEPYVIYMFQALAKTMSGKEVRKFAIYCPLLDEKQKEEESQLIRTKQMSSLELAAAKQLLEEERLKILLMDGSLTHYQIEAKREWEELKKAALEKNVLLAGVSESVRTRQLVKKDAEWEKIYPLDRDLLFGVLEQGEMVIGGEGKGDVFNTWLRPSSSPDIIGVDVLNEQKEYIEDICQFIYMLTPKHGRGIPLFLDIVDKEVRLTDAVVEALVEQYISPELKQRFFVSKRSERLF